MSTATFEHETIFLQHEKNVLLDQFQIAVINLIGNRLPMRAEYAVESLDEDDLHSLTNELESMDGNCKNMNEVIRLIEKRIDDFTR